jgi:AraC family transcriptional regulator
VTDLPRINPHRAVLGARNVVMAKQFGGSDARRHLHAEAVDFAGPLSLKAVLRGQGTWRTAAGRHVVDEGFCLVLNRGDVYSLTFDLAEPSETFCPFFAHGFAEGVARALAAPHAALLDDPAGRGSALEVLPHVRPLDRALAGPLAQLQQLGREADACPLAWDDAFAALAEALVHSAQGWRGEHAEAGRPATRGEITRRLNRARDFIHAEAHGRVTLAEIAGAASLSPHHFHRLFRAAFRATPCDYVSALRLRRAARRLRCTDAPVTEICLAVGFVSLGSFSSRFHRAFGASPMRWCRIARSEKPAPARFA